MSSTTFESLNLSPEINLALKDMGFTTPSPIQAQAIPVLMTGRDIIGQAQTGTGKTAAFAIPIIEQLDATRRNVQAVVLCPTRELAMQVTEEFRKLCAHKSNVQIVSIYGGQPISKQFLALRKRPQIIVGTPGRMMDHLRRGTFRLDAIKTLVLDEADEMLNMGFRDDIETILKQVPTTRQTVLFSATMPKPILDLTRLYQQNPEWIRIETEALDVARIEQQYFEVGHKGKFGVMTGLMDNYEVKRALVFCNTQRQVDAVSEELQVAGYQADGLHGGMSQNQRDRVMGRFRRGMVQMLVATDVAARGIDVQDIEAVFNYDIPEDPENYTHRIGRTARAGKSGRAFTFVSASQMHTLTRIQRAQGFSLLRQSAPGVPAPLMNHPNRSMEMTKDRPRSPYNANRVRGTKPNALRKVVH